MTIAHLWNSMTADALITHVWQSTAFSGLAWLLTKALRNCPAHIRFSVWMAASVKFLLPFAMLTALGSHWALPNSRPPMYGSFNTIIEEIRWPFANSSLGTVKSVGPVHDVVGHSWSSIALVSIWLCGCIVIFIRWARQWRNTRRLVNRSASLAKGREVVVLRNAETKMRIRKPIPLVVTSNTVEPGIFGVVRPVLMWPAGLSERMDDVHIASIIAHELEHVRRRDNLTAALHTLIEAVFWFDPAVWWIGVKMTEERERACDEKVLEQNAEPQAYADSILKVCAFCLDSPPSCVVGISGSDLRKRVLRITRHRVGKTLTFGTRALLLAATVVAIVLPLGFGVVCGQSSTENTGTPKPDAVEAPQFDVASIKPTPASVDKALPMRLSADGISFHGVPMRMVLRTAFGVEDDRIIDAPSWVDTKRYDVEAKVAPEDAPKLDKLNAKDRRDMLIPLLTQRLNLKYHHETRELPMYALVVAKGGPKLTKGEPHLPPALGAFALDQSQPGSPAKEYYKIMMRPGQVQAVSVPINVLTDPLSQFLGRTVVDRTGLTGSYTFTLQWTPDNAPPPRIRVVGRPNDPGHAEDADDAAPLSLFTAIQEQLGLKLDSEKGSVDVIVIDHIDPPSPN